MTAFLASTEFVDASAAQATALGYATVPAIFVPHPIQDRTDAEMARAHNPFGDGNSAARIVDLLAG